jgi:hypothetical protein
MITSSLGASSTLSSAFQLKQANVIAEQKAQQADNLRQSYELAKQQADAAKKQEQKRHTEYTTAEQSAKESKSYANELQAKTGVALQTNPESLFALHQSTKSNITPYDITQRIVKGSLVNTTA